MLAEEIVPNGSTSNWHIKLRSGVTFHNGKPFGADDVIYTLQTDPQPEEAIGRGGSSSTRSTSQG